MLVQIAASVLSCNATSGRRVSHWLLPATAAPTARQAFISCLLVNPGLLQLTVLRHHRRWRSDEPAAVCSECSRTFGVRCSTLWPHNAGATGAALASGSTAGGLQAGLHPGLPVTVRHGSSLPGRADCQLVSDEGRRQQLCRQMFCCCRSKTVEQFSSSFETNWHWLRTV